MRLSSSQDLYWMVIVMVIVMVLVIWILSSQAVGHVWGGIMLYLMLWGRSTSNEGEYRGMVFVKLLAIRNNITKIYIRSDSKLMVGIEKGKPL